jgi:Sec-independent protein translocase protein TatA
MEIFGIGFGELLLIVLIILILFGPKEMVKTGKTLGQWLNRMVRSPTYQVLTKTGEELKNLPRNLMREANLQEFEKDFQQIGEDVKGQTKAIGGALASSFDENKIFAPQEQTAQNKQEQQEAQPEQPEQEAPDNPAPTPKKDA